MAAKPQDGESAVYEMSAWDKIVEKDDYDSGLVRTRNGIVEVYAHQSTPFRASGYTRLWFIHAGRMHCRCYDAHYSRRYLVTLAKRFARDVTDRSI